MIFKESTTSPLVYSIHLNLRLYLDKNHYNIVISLQLIKINEKKKTVSSWNIMCYLPEWHMNHEECENICGNGEIAL